MKEIVDHIKSITESKLKILKYEMVNDGAKLTSNLIFLFILSLGTLLVTTLLSVIILIGLSNYFNSIFISSIITFLIFAVLLGFFYAFLQDKIKKSITNQVYKEVLDKNIDSSQKFKAIKEIEDLKVKYHESLVLKKVEEMTTTVNHSTDTITSLAHLLKNI